MTIIWWLRRDLRLHDNAALAAALRDGAGAVVPVFVLDPRLLAPAYAGAARVRFVLESLREVDAALRERGSRLVVREGDPVTELLAVAREAGAEALYVNRDYEPYARDRDARVQRELEAAGIRYDSFRDRLIIEPDELATGTGAFYTVYTPYRKRWMATLVEQPERAANYLSRTPFVAVPDAIASRTIPDAAAYGFVTDQQIDTPGETAARAQLRRFVERSATGLAAYHQNRNRLGMDGTSRLAPHLRHGTLSPRAAVRAALKLRDVALTDDERKACDTWLGELAWRDFYTAIMWHVPHVLERPYRDLFVDFPFRDAPDELAAWREARTGYPIVDAAMRELNATGFMHNRARMIVASFLIKDLLIDYRAGEQYFLQQLSCGEHSVNNGNWQWCAGSSNDPQPFFRVFNPVTQAETYDPDGAYTRRWLPELAALPDAYLHAPWTMPEAMAQQVNFRLDRDYPAPIVDHKAARERALAVFREHRARHGETAEPDES